MPDPTTNKKVKIVMTQDFTGEHHGVDLASVGRLIGVSIFAPVNLLIEQVGSSKTGYGNYVFARDTKTGLQLRFGHLANPSTLKPGQRINAGTLVGYMGSTGNSSGPHLHFETRTPSNSYIAPPAEWLPRLFQKLNNVVSTAMPKTQNINAGRTSGRNPVQIIPIQTIRPNGSLTSHVTGTAQGMNNPQSYIPNLDRALSNLSQALDPANVKNVSGIAGANFGASVIGAAEGKAAEWYSRIDWLDLAFVLVGLALVVYALGNLSGFLSSQEGEQ